MFMHVAPSQLPSPPSVSSSTLLWRLHSLGIAALECACRLHLHELCSGAVRHSFDSALMQAASKALKEREAALLTLHAIEADLEKRRQAVTAIEGEGQKVASV